MSLFTFSAKLNTGIIPKNNISGFTLLETLASITVLTFVIIGPLTVIIGSSSYARQSKDVMVATHLAEESIELLQNQYDSLYIYCKNQSCSGLAGETSGQTSWRVFKERLTSAGGNVSCYVNDNPSGCNFDYLNMMVDPTVNPIRYNSNTSDCPYLIAVATTSIMVVGGQPSNDLADISDIYVCSGVPGHITDTLANPRQFTRSLTVEQLPTFEAPSDPQYNDDLRVNATAAFKGVNGLTKSVTVTRFFHARP